MKITKEDVIQWLFENMDFKKIPNGTEYVYFDNFTIKNETGKTHYILVLETQEDDN